MLLQVENLDDGTKKIILEGRLDLAGVKNVEPQLKSHTAAQKDAIIIDMGKVEFIASLGMRLLMQCAKAQKNRGGNLVLYRLTPFVYKTLTSAGIDSLIPVREDEASAIQVAQAAR